MTRLTAPGRGAVAVLRLRARRPADAVALQRHFNALSGTDVLTASTGRILYGHWDAEDVVIVRTAEQQWEIHCHGGEAAITRIAADLNADPDALSMPVQPGDLEGQLGLKLLKCRTRRTAAYLLSQQQGVMAEFLDRLQQAVDSDGKEVETPGTSELNRQIERFLSWERFAGHLTQPWDVAVIGRPNAGKSSLLNAVVGYERSIVFAQPGTTRDAVETEIVIDGWPVRLTDTAGIRDAADDDIEATGIAAARQVMTRCDACLLVVDSSDGWTQEVSGLLAAVPKHCPCLVLWNKTDLPSTRPAPPTDVILLPVSVVNGTGVAEVLSWISNTLVPETPEINEPLPVLDDAIDLASKIRLSYLS
ncbi:MAG: GTPase [Fuerstiella sp.]